MNNNNGFVLHIKYKIFWISLTYSKSWKKILKTNKTTLPSPHVKTYLKPWITINLFFLRDKIYLVNFFSCFDFFYKLLHVGGATVSSSRVTAMLLFWLNYACFVSSSPFCNLTKTAKQLSSKRVDHIIKEADKVYQKSVFTWWKLDRKRSLSHLRILQSIQ